MSDFRIGFDEDPSHDYELDVDLRTVAGVPVVVSKMVLVDGVVNNKATVDSNGSLQVKVSAGATGTDATSRGTSGSAPASIPVGTGSTGLLSAATNRRAVWLTNTSTTNTVWLTPGGAAAIVGRGIPMYPGMTICLDKSPNMAVTAISEAGTNTIAIGIEAD